MCFFLYARVSVRGAFREVVADHHCYNLVERAVVSGELENYKRDDDQYGDDVFCLEGGHGVVILSYFS